MKLAYLVESLNTVLPYHKTISSATAVSYTFEFNGLNFIVEFKYTLLPGGDKVATVVFYEVSSDGIVDYKQTHKHKFAFSLFATVAAIITDTIPSWQALMFAADGTSRVGLYTSLTKRFSSQLNTYQVNGNSGVLWILSKQPIPPEDLEHMKQAADIYISSKQP